jgi:ADP-ribosylglycohydrolase
MERMESRERILGSILGAAVGDAMGAVTETKTPEMIKNGSAAMSTTCCPARKIRL